ncbi:uncharacterized protein B0I36DRAFT_344283 [Microdochium trichocladiopsis]|uniref:Uncharacterized protein n=1 Tax=Microdochium trichocladiopsis TaxID=1682393 RepID=A0A9P9BU16_9PEZI|nr:uncharacterized protein B0I36DRAFT_344283 [Microdochium trichocladiopsis]KAH7040556.1 hypothetical protein B0I36DRAFT_344283 [Microdochium trichocladiopsis]
MPPKKDSTTSAAGDATTHEPPHALPADLPPSAKTQGDWAKVAEKAGLKDEKSARESFRQLCKKHGWYEAAPGSGDQAGAGATPAKAPRKRATPKSKKAVSADGDGDGVTAEQTPTKKQKQAVVDQEDADDDMNELFDVTGASYA